MKRRTRIKICGLTRVEDVQTAVAAGADALGFVFYRPSPRFLAGDAAHVLARAVPPFITRVGLFVNEAPAVVREMLATVDLELLQFHGDEDEAYCRQFRKPYIKAARVRPSLDLLEYARAFPSAQGLLLDAHVEAYGGVGQTFDWSLIPPSLPLPIVLSGGLTCSNVEKAVAAIQPFAVDVSSGVEVSKGIKDPGKIVEFINAVRCADNHGNSR